MGKRKMNIIIQDVGTTPWRHPRGVPEPPHHLQRFDAIPLPLLGEFCPFIHGPDGGQND